MSSTVIILFSNGSVGSVVLTTRQSCTTTKNIYMIRGLINMASRILFEHDIVDQIPITANGDKLYTDITIKKEDDSTQDTCSTVLSQEKESDTVDTTILSSNEVNAIAENVIVLGSRVYKQNEIPNEQAGNISQDEGNKGNVTVNGKGKAKGKRKNKTELELLGIDIKKNDEDLDGLYDVFGDENKIIRKYKLRKTEQPIIYKEPADIIPIRRISTDDEIDLTCSVCQQEFENKIALLNHLRMHNKTVHEYTCSLCSKKFDKNADLIAHREKHSEESFLCQECKLAFSDYCDYLLHNHEHMSQPHFKCSECGVRYRKSVYKLHVLTHFEKKLSCDLCPFVTSGEYNLRAHRNQHKYKVTCVECGKVCCKKDYEYHMSMHTGVKKYQCLYCGACFRNPNAKNVHTRIHTGEKPFTCDICGHKARQSTDMKRHKETHGTEKQYTCDVCGKKYLHKDYLVVHMRSHTKKCLYECPECEATFVSVNGLKTHTMFKHTSERPVECTLCDKKFINDNQYRKHCRAKYHLRNVYGDTKNKKNGETKNEVYELE